MSQANNGTSRPLAPKPTYMRVIARLIFLVNQLAITALITTKVPKLKPVAIKKKQSMVRLAWQNRGKSILFSAPVNLKSTMCAIGGPSYMARLRGEGVSSSPGEINFKKTL